MFDVAFISERCPDGVELVEYPEPEPLVYSPSEQPFPAIPAGQPLGDISQSAFTGGMLGNYEPPHEGGVFYRCNSERRSSQTVSAIDLGNPVALQFIATHDTDATLAFFHRWGTLAGFSEEPAKKVEQAKSAVRGIVDAITETPQGLRAQMVNRLLEGVRLKAEVDYSGPKQTGRMVFYAETLFQYMAVEVAVAVMRGVGVVNCANCGNAFFTGPAAGRRSDAKICSEKCRSALRRRNATAPA